MNPRISKNLIYISLIAISLIQNPCAFAQASPEAKQQRDMLQDLRYRVRNMVDHLKMIMQSKKDQSSFQLQQLKENRVRLQERTRDSQSRQQQLLDQQEQQRKDRQQTLKENQQMLKNQ